jgi:hypothetical protein
MAFALDELEKQCGHFFERKGIEWKAVRKEMTEAARATEDDSQHLYQLYRLLARLRDGHAEVRPLEKGKDVKYDWGDPVGPGLFVCKVGKKVYAKATWSAAAECGLEPGMEILTFDDVPASKWLDQKTAELRDVWSFSTDQHALFHTIHRGFAAPSGTRLDVEYKNLEGKKKKRTLTYKSASLVPSGPAFYPGELESAGESIAGYGRTSGGFGYVHVRRTKPEVVAEIDVALAALSDAPGLILDFRGNSGGGCDHDALEARFVPSGKELPRLARQPLPSAGPHPYGGPIVVIVDGTVVSAGETTSGMLEEDGRAYMIGESATAGMSSQKATIDLPSGLFQLYVSVESNRSSFNGGLGIEGIGVAPHEVVEFDPKDLADKKDTLILRAEELLRTGFPKGKVAYDPQQYGWGE